MPGFDKISFSATPQKIQDQKLAPIWELEKREKFFLFIFISQTGAHTFLISKIMLSRILHSQYM